jgi:hypothetical protein
MLAWTGGGSKATVYVAAARATSFLNIPDVADIGRPEAIAVAIDPALEFVAWVESALDGPTGDLFLKSPIGGSVGRSLVDRQVDARTLAVDPEGGAFWYFKNRQMVRLIPNRAASQCPLNPDSGPVPGLPRSAAVFAGVAYAIYPSDDSQTVTLRACTFSKDSVLQLSGVPGVPQRLVNIGAGLALHVRPSGSEVGAIWVAQCTPDVNGNCNFAATTPSPWKQVAPSARDLEPRGDVEMARLGNDLYWVDHPAAGVSPRLFRVRLPPEFN